MALNRDVPFVSGLRRAGAGTYYLARPFIEVKESLIDD